MAIGSYRNDDSASNAGHVRIFEYTNNDWNQVGVDLDGDDQNDFFGRAVALSNDGTILSVGATHDEGTGGYDTGRVRVYSYQ